MFKKILVPTDGSELSEKSALAAIHFASGAHATIIAVHVTQKIPALSMPDAGGILNLGDYEEAQKQVSKHFVDKIRAQAEQAGVKCEAVSTRADYTYEEILSVATNKQCDLIWMASRARSELTKLLLGSETQRVLSHTSIPVLVYPSHD